MAKRTLTGKPSVPKLASRQLLQKFGIHPKDREAAALKTLDMSGTRALCIATNHAVLDIGVATGVFASELTVPYYVFLDTGMEVDVASPFGGIIPVDPLSMKEAIRTPEDDRLLDDGVFREKLMNSLPIASLDFTAYDIIFLAGGWGAAFDLGQSEVLGRKMTEAYAAGRVLGGICHGPLGLLRGRTPDGELIVKGRRLTAVTDKQIQELGIGITPLHPETALRQAGALFEGKAHKARDFFANHYVEDGDLITGQNQNAGPMVARLMMQRVQAKRPAKRRKGVMNLAGLPRKPNILLIVTDQEREVMHWPSGWAEANLPARQRLLAHGLQFTQAQCNTAACSASRATLLTGLYPAQHGVKNIIQFDDPKDRVQSHLPVLSGRLPNLATVMAAAGYHVVFKGKFHLSRPVQYNREMKRYYWSEADIAHMAKHYGFHGWNPPDMSDPQSLSDLGGGAINNDGRFVDGSGTAAGEIRPYDELHRRSAVHFLNTYDGDKPFCLIVALVNPHDVQEYPGRGIRGVSIKSTFEQGGYRLEDFKDLPIGLPPNLEDDLSTKPSVHASFRQLLAVGTGHVRTRERQLNYARFYAYLIQQVDAQIVKLLDALDANGLTEDTVILRTSDHGELGMSHGRMRQKFYNAYRETLSVPLIVSNPRLYPQPQSTDAFASLIDVLPTLATVAGTPEPERYGFKGRDLNPILSDPKAEVQDVLHFTYEDDVFPVKGADCIRAIVERGWKYAVYYDPFTGAPTEYEMYDLKDDPLEMTNLAHPEHGTGACEIERTRLHRRLSEVMRANGTVPDEIRWPEVGDYRAAKPGDTAS